LVLHITLFIAENGENSSAMKAQLDSLGIYECVAYNILQRISALIFILFVSIIDVFCNEERKRLQNEISELKLWKPARSATTYVCILL